MKSLFCARSKTVLAVGVLMLALGGTASAQLLLDPGSFTAADVGNPVTAGSSTAVAGGFDLSGSGTGIGGGTNDQFQFFYQSYTGDFDVAVRLDSLSFTDPWTKAGLMARDSLNGNSRFDATLTTPAGSGSFFSFRGLTGGATTNQGSFPTTYPNMWLRLKRAGNTFSGYASVSGTSWTVLGTHTGLSAAPPTLLVGMVASSRRTNDLASARFRSLNNVVGEPPVGGLTGLGREPLGPSTRRSGFTISEIMYHPLAVLPETNRSLEFIEIYNGQVFQESLGNHRLSGSIDYKFPANLTVGPGQFVVVARDPAYVESHYGISGVLGPWNGSTTNNLPGGGGLLRLRNPAGAVLVEVPYRGENPWPIAADGSGHSLVLSRPSYGERDPKAWTHSGKIGGTPGKDEPYLSDPLGAVMINEILAHTDDEAEDFVELYNHSSQSVDISGTWLSDEGDEPKYQIPEDSVIPPRSFAVFNQGVLGFSLSAGGERVYFFSRDRTRVVDVVDYAAQANGVSSGRYPDGAAIFSALSQPTPGDSNAPISLPPVVINEIMYNPITGNNNDEYVELYNRSGLSQDLSGWRLRGGADFDFPSNTVLAAGSYLVVAENKTNLLAHYANLSSANTVGDYDGSLGNGGERLSLQRPVVNINYDTNTAAFVTNRIFVPVNELTYSDGGRWGNWTDGGGSSLELKDPNSDNRQPANWGDSDESSKAPWTNIEVTGNIGANQGPPDRLLIFDLGVGEFLIDDVEVRNSGAVNLVRNGDFELGLTNWVLQGSHDQSTLETVGFGGSRSLHVRAASRGDNGANRVRTTAISGVASANVTLRAKVRWIRGWPEVLLRLNGGGLECSGKMTVPSNLGTPGARNSQTITNAGPAVYDVMHSPALPTAQENVVVTARASDPGGVARLSLKYRLDTAIPGTFSAVPMLDDGASPDTVAGDGIYSALLPGRPTGAAVSFYIEAADAAGATNTFPQNLFPVPGLTRCYPFDSLSRECVVRWGDRQMSGSIPSYHIWCTLANIQRWDQRDDLNNAPLDGTFVYNNYRVVYNARPQFAGSPWHQGAMTGGPTNNGSRVDYVCNFPEDDQFLGATDTVLATAGNPEGNHGTDNSGQTEQTSYIIFREMGLQYNHRRWIRLFVNGNERSMGDNLATSGLSSWVMEDAQQPNSDMVDEWFPEDNDGELYKIEDWFEFTDTGARGPNEDADLGRRENVINGKTVLNPAPYRFMWRKRAVDPGVSASDYRSIHEMINTVSPTLTYTESSNLPIPDPAGFDRLADVEQWMRIFAVQHAVGNWDSYGYERGKNAYAYKPRGGRFVQWTWDIDFTMGVGGNGATTSLFALGGDGDRRVEGMWATPVFRRMYWRAFEDMVNGPWSNTYLDPILDAKAAALSAHGIAYVASTVNTIKTFVRDRRTYLLGQLNTANGRWTVREPTNSLSTNLLVLTGTAPVAMRDIYLNGAYYPITWTSVSNWTMRVILKPGTNTLVVRGYKPDGTPATNDVLTVTAVYDGTAADPTGSVVFNEIMYNPLQPEASFIELYNRSGSAFDLSGWRVRGLSYEFPIGAILSPGQYLVLAKNPAAYLGAYPGAVGAFGQFSGNLDTAGEILTLLRPMGSGAPEQIVDQIRYENRLPWGTSANGFGNSLQLVDANQDNTRPSNWRDREDWRYVTYTGIAAPNIDTNFFIWLTNAGNVYIDDIVLVTGAVANVGQNLIVNGDFESALQGPWTVIGNHSNSMISTTISHSGNGSLYVECSGGLGSPASGALRQLIEPFATNTQCTLSYWFRPTTNASLITLRLRNGSTFSSVSRVSPVLATPGNLNTVASALPPYDALWLNELQPVNISGPTDNRGERDPWIEIYNSGDTPVDLSGYYLADNYAGNLTQWQFPSLSTIGAKEFKIIWADGQPDQTVGNNLHTSFKLNSSTGSVALVRVVNDRPQITDYLTYANVGPGQSYGDYPDGQLIHRQVLFDASPSATNVARYVDIRINEWMAANTNSIADPADPAGSGYDDWFELYNAGTTAVDLGGFYLTDNPSDEDDFYRIPANGQYVIAPGQFFLVWADGTPEQNSPARRDLHVPFNLARTGETVALYAPDGETLIDQVQFGAQEDDVSEGRFPDGSRNITALAIPTPCNPNVTAGGNVAPSIAAIQPRSIRLGETVSFTATATDPGAPPQLLSFSLVPVSPAGAQIDPNSGLFTWTPTSAQAPSTNEIKLRVTDNGNPPMSGVRNVTVIVLLGPQSTITRTGPSEVTLSFDTTPGRTYQVQYKTHLSDAEWVNFGPAQVAGGTSLTVTDDLTGNPQRFYRIQLLSP